MRLGGVRIKSPHQPPTPTISDSSAILPSTSPKGESTSSGSTRRRLSIFRSLRRYPSKQEIAHSDFPSGSTPCASLENNLPCGSTLDSKQTTVTAAQDLSQAPLIEQPSPKRSQPLETPTPLRKHLHTQAVAPSTGPRPQLPRSSLRYSRTPSPSERDLDTRYRGVPSVVHVEDDYISATTRLAPQLAFMTRRRIWVRRPGATPTQVHINDDDLVDDVKDMILRKYGNSLGRNFDSPDVTIRLVPRERSMPERALGPDELMVKTLEACFPGGQAVEEALLIDVPAKRTPKPSPRIASHGSHYFEDHRPMENGTEYFPPMPVPSPGHASSSHDSRLSYHAAPHTHSIAILETGQVPPLPSPGARKATHRPRMGRTHTSSPTILGSGGQSASYGGRTVPRARRDSDHSRPAHVPAPPPLPTPPIPELASSNGMLNKAATPPIDRVSSPRPAKAKKSRRPLNVGAAQQSGNEMRNNYLSLLPGILDNSVPPINVLIVEDNIINLKLLEQLARKLKIRWSTAMNGRDAVDKWRTGGFHLVLMDIQLPIMNGLEATKEIRRLERLNGIAVFARSSADESGSGNEKGGVIDDEGNKPTADADKLDPTEMIKSPVIIVALTASSLQSDRHEALAAGCNDFLTKPVNTVWFERKVMEWGCMQALIDFEGWRKWKDLSKEQEREKLAKEKNMSAEELEKRRKKEARKEANQAALLAKMGQG